MLAPLIFWFSFFLLCYTYILYPFLLELLFARRKVDSPSPKANSSFNVFILMAAHNEESVIVNKLKSIDLNDYPVEKIQVYIGSDNSTDKTNTLIQDYISKSKYPIHFTIMPKRSGKIGTLNHLYHQIKKTTNLSAEDIFISTDADVLFSKSTISHLIRHFANKKIGLVDTHIKNTPQGASGVSKSESTYLSREVKLKHQEGIVFGRLMGAFGGCFAIRSTCFSIIPENLRVDDFYLSMNVMVKGYDAISDPEAICFEKVGTSLKQEFKRKRRISSGNFQNLALFKNHIFQFNALSFVFFSHKVIRYFGPLLMISIFISSAYLASNGSMLMQIAFSAQIAWYFAVPLLDKLCQLIGINILALRIVSYFNYMNFALLLGLKDYIKGIDSNIWEPTKRN